MRTVFDTDRKLLATVKQGGVCFSISQLFWKLVIHGWCGHLRTSSTASSTSPPPHLPENTFYHHGCMSLERSAPLPYSILQAIQKQEEEGRWRRGREERERMERGKEERKGDRRQYLKNADVPSRLLLMPPLLSCDHF